MRNKKLIVIALAFAVLMTGVLYAQDEDSGTVGAGKGAVKIDGSVKTGVRMDVTSRKVGGNANGDESNVPVIYGYSDDIDDGTGLRASLQATYENGRVGFKVGVRGEAGQNDSGSFPLEPGALMAGFNNNYTRVGVYNAYGWLKLFSDKFVISGGLIDDDIWGTGALGDTKTDTNFDAVNGFRLALQPVEGLSFGVAFDITPTTLGGLVGTDQYVSHSGQPVGAFFSNMRIGGLYKSDAFGAALTVKLNGKDNDNGEFKGMDILFGFKLMAVPNLLVVLDGKVYNLLADENVSLASRIDLPSERGKLFASLKGIYTINEKLHVGARYIAELYMAHNGDKDGAGGEKNSYYANNLDSEIRLYGNYDFTEVVNAGIEAAVKIDGKTDEQATSNDDKKNGSLSAFIIRPIAKFKITEGLKITIYDDVTITPASYFGHSYKDGAEPAGYINNRLQLDFIWSF